MSAVVDPLVSVTPIEAVTQSLVQEFAGLPAAASQCMMVITYLFAGIVLPSWGKVGGEDVTVKIAVKSAGLPIGAGLGSSAAFSVATAGAFVQLHFKLNEPQQTWGSDKLNRSVLESINAWAFVGEVLLHGTPSGLDNTTSCFGGMVKFQRTDTGNVFDTLEHVPTLNMLLTNTKVPRSTKLLVAGVRVLHDDMPGVIQPIFTSIANITTEFVALCERYNHVAAVGC
jgi:mevalonate kinase